MITSEPLWTQVEKEQLRMVAETKPHAGAAGIAKRIE